MMRAIKLTSLPSLSVYPLRTAEQLPLLLRAFRKASGLTQADIAARMGVTQQTYSALERNAAQASAARLLTLLGILGVEWVLHPVHPPGSWSAREAPPPGAPHW